MPRSPAAAKSARAKGKIKPPRTMSSPLALSATPDLSGLQITDETGLMCATVYRAINLIANNIASFPLKVYKRSLDGERERKEHAFNHPVNQKLQFQPHPEYTPFTWMQAIVKEMIWTGNAYVEIEWSGNNSLVSMRPLVYPVIVTPERDPQTDKITYRITSDAGTYRKDPVQMLHIPMIGDGLVGKSPRSLMRQTLGAAISAEGYGAAHFGSGSNPAGILTHPGKLGDQAKNNLRSALESAHKGVKNAGRILILEEGMTWTQTAVNANDSQYLETRTFEVAEIARWFGVPSIMLNDMAKATFNNVEQLNTIFATHTLRPICTAIEQELNRKLIPDKSRYYVKFTMDALLRGDASTRTEQYTKMSQIGVYSVNDIRELEDLNDIGPDGDKRLVQINLTTLEKIGEDKPIPTGLNPFGKPAGPPEPEEPEEPDAEDGDEDEEPEDEDGNRVDQAMYVLFRDACGRVVHREIGALRRLIGKHPSADELDEAVRNFYGEFENIVVRELGPPWLAIAAVNGEPRADVSVGASRYVNASREAILSTLRTTQDPQRVATLLDSWTEFRADNVSQDFAGAYRNASTKS